jgi:RND family efflux transporter MFP subunit
MMFASCNSNNKQKAHDNEGHEHEHPSLAMTVFADGYELFVEFPALTLNEESLFNAHITNLNTYKPLKDAKLSLKLVGLLESSAESSATIGIYKPVITPKKIGKYMGEISFMHAEKKITFSLGELRVYTSDDEAAHDITEEHSDNITFLKEQAWKGVFGVEKAKKSAFNEIIRCTGEIIPSVQDDVSIIAPVSGLISINTNLLAGIKLEKNTCIANINGEMFENSISNKFLKTKAKYKAAKNNYERGKQLAKEKIISTRELDNLYTEYVAAKTSFDYISKNYSKNGKNILSPTSGVLAEVLVGDGDYVEVGQIIAQIHVEHNYMLRADLPKRKAFIMDDIYDANFKPEYSEKTFSISEMEGARIASKRVANDKSAYMPVYFTLPFDNELIAHSYAEVYLKARVGDNLISLPNAALMESEGKYWIFTQVGGESFEKRDVKIGASDGKRTHIIEGLEENEYVVVKGAYRLKQASMSTAIPAHAH